MEIFNYFLLSSVKEKVDRERPLEKEDDDSTGCEPVVNGFVGAVTELFVNDPEVAPEALLWVTGLVKVTLASNLIVFCEFSYVIQ